MGKMRNYTYGSPKFECEINKAISEAGGATEGADVKSTGVTSGKVLTANGTGGASWETASGGDGDVTASGTLTSNNIILGNGTKSVKAMTAGTRGQFLHRGQNAPEWVGLYRHTIYVYYSGDDNAGELHMYLTVISTDSTAYTSIDSIPDGWHIANGNYNDIYTGNGQCRVIYFNRGYNDVGYWATTDESMATMSFMSAESATVTDHVEAI